MLLVLWHSNAAGQKTTGFLLGNGDAEHDEAVDPVMAKKDMRLFHDGEKHWLGVIVVPARGIRSLVYGDGKKFYTVPLQTFDWDDGELRFGAHFWEPRIETGRARFDVVGAGTTAKATVDCGVRKVELKEVEGDERDAMLERAQFLPRRFQRLPHVLSRDDYGTYYYVDRSVDTMRLRNARLFVGKKGAMRQVPLRTVVADSEGELFVTRRGTLRIDRIHTLVPPDARSRGGRIEVEVDPMWVKGESRGKLRNLDLGLNQRLIFQELGVYSAEPFGTPCDDM